MRRPPMIPLIYEIDNKAMLRNGFANGKPVVQKAKNAVQNDHRSATFTDLFIVELHGYQVRFIVELKICKSRQKSCLDIKNGFKCVLTHPVNS